MPHDFSLSRLPLLSSLRFKTPMTHGIRRSRFSKSNVYTESTLERNIPGRNGMRISPSRLSVGVITVPQSSPELSRRCAPFRSWSAVPCLSLKIEVPSVILPVSPLTPNGLSGPAVVVSADVYRARRPDPTSVNSTPYLPCVLGKNTSFSAAPYATWMRLIDLKRWLSRVALKACPPPGASRHLRTAARLKSSLYE